MRYTKFCQCIHVFADDAFYWNPPCQKVDGVPPGHLPWCCEYVPHCRIWSLKWICIWPKVGGYGSTMGICTKGTVLVLSETSFVWVDYISWFDLGLGRDFVWIWLDCGNVFEFKVFEKAFKRARHFEQWGRMFFQTAGTEKKPSQTIPTYYYYYLFIRALFYLLHYMIFPWLCREKHQESHKHQYQKNADDDGISFGIPYFGPLGANQARGVLCGEHNDPRLEEVYIRNQGLSPPQGFFTGDSHGQCAHVTPYDHEDHEHEEDAYQYFIRLVEFFQNTQERSSHDTDDGEFIVQDQAGDGLLSSTSKQGGGHVLH